MKYKVGDKVKIKTWEKMTEEFGFYIGKFGFYKGTSINNPEPRFISEMEKNLPDDRIMTIEYILKYAEADDFYRMVGSKWDWSDDMIECKVSEETPKTEPKQKKQTQKEFVLEVLKRDGFITRNFCLQHYITKLGAIISSLKDDGYEFDAEYVKVNTSWGTGKDYTYTLKEYK